MIVSAAIIKLFLYILLASLAFNKETLLTRFSGVSFLKGVSFTSGIKTSNFMCNLSNKFFLAREEDDNIILLISFNPFYLCLKIILPLVKS